MFEQLKEIEHRYEQLCEALNSAEIWSDPTAVARINMEQKTLEPVVSLYRRFCRLSEECDAARDLLEDPEFREIAKEELNAKTAELSRTESELRVLLRPKDPNNGKNVIMEIRGGVGGEEGMLFAADLFRMYSMFAQKMGWGLEVVNSSPTELGGFKEICFTVSGSDAWSALKYEAGTHRVQRIPVTESGGRIQTSAATVAVLPEAEECDFTIDPGDLKIDTFKSSGAGGQHVNKTESAIRITHLPTGLVVECQDERSQYKNKDRAMKILRSRLLEAELEKRNADVAAKRKIQVGSGDRSERIRTYNFPQNRVTDHRLSDGSKNFNIASVINGDMIELINALRAAEAAAEGSEAAHA